MGLKEKVINYLNEKLDNLNNTSEKDKLRNLVVRQRDLTGIINVINKYDFINQEEIGINDILLMNPDGEKESGKILYTNELLKYDIDVIAIKVVSEVICYLSGVCTFTKNKMLSYIYLTLAHLTLIDFSIKYYSQNKRNALYELFKSSDPDIIDRYNIDFSIDKINYYIQFALTNHETHFAFLTVNNKYSFSNGSLLICYRYNFHITSTYGIEFLAARQIDETFENYVRISNRCKQITNPIETRRYYLDSNNNLTTDRKTINELNLQFKTIQTLI